MAKKPTFPVDDEDDATSEGTCTFKASMLITLPRGLPTAEDALEDALEDFRGP